MTMYLFKKKFAPSENKKAADRIAAINFIKTGVFFVNKEIIITTAKIHPVYIAIYDIVQNPNA